MTMFSLMHLVLIVVLHLCSRHWARGLDTLNTGEAPVVVRASSVRLYIAGSDGLVSPFFKLPHSIPIARILSTLKRTNQALASIHIRECASTALCI
jgi:hypothetical protein